MNELTSADVQAALDRLGIKTQVRTFESSTATAPQAADAIGTELGSIVKSLFFLVEEQPVVVLTAGDQRVDDRKLGTIFGVSRKKVRIADAETTVAVTGYSPGGVPPVGHRTQIPILIDSTLQRYDTVYAAAGAANAIFPVALDDLVRVTQGRLVDVAKDPAPEQP